MPTTKRRQHAETKYGQRAVVELLLAEEVPSLGKQGEIVRVRPGYARNYLLPYGLATVATEDWAAVTAHKLPEQHAAREVGKLGHGYRAGVTSPPTLIPGESGAAGWNWSRLHSLS